MIEGTLSPSERELLRLVCDTFVPSVESAEQSKFHSRKASDIGVDSELAHLIENELRPESRRQMQQMLGYFENRLFNLLMHRKLRPFSQLSQRERERYLRAWANSRFSRRRTGFQALKRLTLFLNYSLPDMKGINPNRQAIGYDGPPILEEKKKHHALPARQHITPLQPTEEKTLECDACVIGSGAGGSVIASTLSRAGLRVIILEYGEYNTPQTFTQQEYGMMRSLYLDGGTYTTRDLSFTLLAGVGAGGGTVVNWMTCLRPPRWLLEEWEQDFGITDLTSSKFSTYLSEVEETLKVNTAESQRNPNNDVLWEGCKKLGYTEQVDFSIIPRNAYQCKERCGPCSYGCIYNGKQSTLLNYLPDAFSAGAQFLFNTRANLIEILDGRVRSVEATHYSAKGEIPIHLRTKLAVVACGAVNSSALLLRSGFRQNVGRGLLLDPTTAIASIYEKPIRMWDGPMQTVNVTKYLNLDGQHHGFWIEAVPGHPGLIALSLPWLGGSEHKEMMMRALNSAGTIILVREKGSGTIRIDKHGSPICDYEIDALDKKHIMQGILAAARINLAAGAREIWTLHTRRCFVRADSSSSREQLLDDLRRQIVKEGIAANRITLFSAHLMGGCRMGKDTAKSVVGVSGQVYGVKGLYVGDASIFPSSPGVNPMITIMAMARRTADAILARERPEANSLKG